MTILVFHIFSTDIVHFKTRDKNTFALTLETLLSWTERKTCARACRSSKNILLYVIVALKVPPTNYTDILATIKLYGH